MKVLATIVLAPHWLVAGGPNAALRLSLALSRICDIDLARMAPADARQRCQGLTIFDLRCSNPFSPVRFALPQNLFMLFYRARIPDLIRRGHYDLVHIHNPLPALEMKRIARACLQTNVPYVVSTHGLVELSSKGTALELGGIERIAWRLLVDAPFRYVLHHAAAVMALSPADAPILTALGCVPERIRIVPNGVHVPAQASAAGEIERVCAKFGLPFPKPLDVPVGMFLANHTKNKGVSVLLDAFGAYTGPFRLIVAGSQRPHIDYDKFARQARPQQSFNFPGFVTDEEVNVLFDYADVFVFPTLSDTFPLVILEAMAHGLPVLSTRVGGIPYQVPESCGSLVEAGNPKALMDAFETLASNRDRLSAMRSAAKAHVERNFSWDTSAEQALAVYRQTLSQSLSAASRVSPPSRRAAAP